MEFLIRPMTIDEIINLKIPCFSCPHSHSCAYYGNTLWDEWLFQNPESGCPALMYPYESIYISVLNQMEKNKKAEYIPKSEWAYKVK